MKQKASLLAFATFILCGSVFSQIYTPTNPTTFGQNANRINSMQTFHIPIGSSAASLNSGLNQAGALYYRTSDNYLYIYNGTTWDKYAKFSDITTGITGSGTTNYLPKWTGSTALGNSSLFQGTDEMLLEKTSNSVDVAFRAKNNSTGGSYSTAAMTVENSTSVGKLFKAGTAYGTYKTITNSDLGFYNTTAGNISILNDYSGGNILFSAGGNSTAGLAINTSNNVGIGNAAPAVKLDVTGQARITDSLSIGLTGNYANLGTGSKIPLSIYSKEGGAYSRYISIRNDSINSNAVSRQLGIAFSLSDESSSGEANKSASISLFSGSAWANDPTLSFVANGVNVVNMNGSVGFAVGSNNGFTVNATSQKITKYANSSITNGQMLIGHTSNGTFEKATLTAGQNISITNGAGSVTIATDITLAQGTYTPTLTNTTNITSSTAYTTHYFRVGDQITVWGQVEITSTAVGAVELQMSLPVATSNFNNTYEAAGTASEGTADPTKFSNVRILAVTSEGKVKFIYDDQVLGSKTFSFSFSYKWVAP